MIFLRITEIMYNPAEVSSLEFIELHNVSDRWTLDLSHVAFTNGVDFRFEEGAVLPPEATLVLVSNRNAFAAHHPNVEIYGTYDGSLENGGEKLTLRDAANQTILSVDYDDGGLWPRSPDGLGFSLVLRDPDGDFDHPFTWRASAAVGGSPGAADPDVPPHHLVRITEVLAREGREPNTFIEIRNFHDEPIDFAGWFLSDSAESADALRKFRIPENLGGEEAVFVGPQLRGFELTASTRTVYLAAADSAGNLTGHIFGLDLRPAEPGISFGLYETSLGLQVTPLNVPTPGEAAATPWISPVVINEIHYNPLLDSGVEFVELHNPGSSPVSLYDEVLEMGWRLRGVSGALDGYEFPDGTSIPPGGFLLVVGGDTEIFREQHSVPPEIEVLGPFSGALDNGGERISLTKPVDIGLGIGADSTAEFRTDTVRFNDKAPWPIEADGGGPSLERIDAASYAGDPINWAASRGDSGTPSRTNSVSEVPLGGSQLPGDIDQNGRLNIVDIIQFLGHLFRGAPTTLPCGDGTVDAPGNRSLLDANGDGLADVSDAVYEIRYVFLKGPPHVLGSACRAIPDCPALCQN